MRLIDIGAICGGTHVAGTELFDAVSSASIGATATSPNTNSWTHTPVNTPNAVTVNLIWSENINSAGSVSIASVSYGGHTMTELGSVIQTAYTLSKFTLLSPPSGAQTVSVVWQNDDGASLSSGTATATTYYSTSNGSASFGALDTASDSTSPITNDVTGTSINNVLDHAYLVYDGASAAVTITVNGTNETKRSGTTTIFSSGQYARGQFVTTSQTSAAGTVTASATISAGRSCKISSVEVVAQ